MVLRVLGISALYHDSAAALIEDGRIFAAAQVERITRRKYDSRFPVREINYLLVWKGGGTNSGPVESDFDSMW
jgi:carbamoyltransferase